MKAADGEEIGFAILAVGKFGGREMNYGSDLDVLFFFSRDGETEKGLLAGMYFNELAQTLARAFEERTALGALYTLDARLRPNGNKGPLASSLEAFERYWKEGDLCDWERLALTRARFVAGDARTGERAEHLIRSAVYSPLRSKELATEVRAMRKRLEETASADDIKRGRGGLADIEFLTQYLQLQHGSAFPPIRKTNTKEALQTLMKLKKLPDAAGKALLEGYGFFSLLANRLRVVHGLSANTLPEQASDLRKLALRAGYFDSPDGDAGKALRADYERIRKSVREIFEQLVH